ncbi:MAG: hypothetical protein ABI614_04245 [Planctomycetota bacterium]
MELLKVVLEFMFKMVAHPLISVAMTALVLVCPYQCGDCCGMSRTDACVDSDSCDAGDKAGCDCGGDREEQPARDDDRPGGSKEADCFCNGAVLSVGTRCPDHDVDRGLFGAVVINTSLTRQFAGTGSRDPALRCGSHFPPLLSGRDICTLVSSYLL